MFRTFRIAGTNPVRMFDTARRKRLLVGVVIMLVLAGLFFPLNRFPKWDIIQSEAEAVTGPRGGCFQGFCIEPEPPAVDPVKRWWDSSLTWMNVNIIGMSFAFLAAGLVSTFIVAGGGLKRAIARTGIRGSILGVGLGAPMTLCSGCITPVAASYHKKGASTETTIAVTQASATLDPLSIVMLLLMFPLLLSGSRLVMSFAAALLFGLILARLLRRPATASAENLPGGVAPARRRWVREEAWEKGLVAAGLALAFFLVLFLLSNFFRLPGPLLPSVAAAVVSGIVLTRFLSPPSPEASEIQPGGPPEGDAPWRRVLREGLWDWGRSTGRITWQLGPIMVASGFIIGFVSIHINAATVQSFLGNSLFGVLLAATIGVAVNTPKMFEIPLTAGLLGLGMGIGPAAALLFTAAAAGPVTVWGLGKVMGWRIGFGLLGLTWLLGVAGGLGVLALGAAP
jgi:uncharacterized membrane protein YraQ (UPF0718 family)